MLFFVVYVFEEKSLAYKQCDRKNSIQKILTLNMKIIRCLFGKESMCSK